MLEIQPSGRPGSIPGSLRIRLVKLPCMQYVPFQIKVTHACHMNKHKLQSLCM